MNADDCECKTTQTNADLTIFWAAFFFFFLPFKVVLEKTNMLFYFFWNISKILFTVTFSIVLQSVMWHIPNNIIWCQSWYEVLTEVSMEFESFDYLWLFNSIPRSHKLSSK